MANDDEVALLDWVIRGERDRQTVTHDWLPVDAPLIAGASLKEIRPVASSTGYLTEVWRRTWAMDDLPVDQIIQRTLEPGAVSGWHAHALTTDRLFCVGGSVQISLFDGRRSSPSCGKLWHRIIGEKRPVLVLVPPGVWHGVKTVGATAAILLNIVDREYSYESPDHWRLPPDNEHIPFKLI